MNRLRIVPCLFLATLTAALAQTPAPGVQAGPAGQAQQKPPQPPGKVSGRVLRADTGAGLLKSTVILSMEGRPGEMLTTRVDSNGAFEFPEVAPGRYRISAERNGYVRQTYGQRGGGPGLVLDLPPRQALDRIEFRLERAGVITGAVVDEDNEPIEGLEVRAQRLRFMPGGRQRATALKTARTDDLGNYRLTGLAPGFYYVQAGGRGEGTFLSPYSTGFTYAAQYFASSPVVEGAQRVQVTTGAETRRIDFFLRAASTYQITGIIIDPLPAAGPRSYSAGTQTSMGMSSFSVGDDGKFTMRGVLPGDYMLFAATASPGGDRRTGYRRATLTEADLQVAIEIGKTAEVRGEAKLVGDGALPGRLFITLQGETDVTPFAGGQVAEGRFEIKNIAEGTYTVLVNDPTNSTYMREIRCAGEDFTTQRITLAADQKLEDCRLTLGNDVAQVAASVTRGLEPAESVIVVLIPKDEDKRQNPRFTTLAQTDKTGVAQLRGVVPGDYFAYAFNPSDDAVYYDPEFPARNRDLGTSVTVQPNGQQALALQVITPR